TTIIVTIVGLFTGAIAAFFGGWLDTISSRGADIFFAIPLLLAAIVGLSALNNVWPDRGYWGGVFAVVIALAAFGWPQFTRIARGAVMEIKNLEFVDAARSLGVSKWRNLFSHIIPNALPPVIVTATVSLGVYIVAEATLSFLGIGLPPSVVSWGNDIAAAQPQVRSGDNLHVLLFPAGGLAITVLSFMLLGDAVRDALDPQARKYMTAETPLIEIENLHINFKVNKRQVQAVQGLTLTVYPGQTVAIVGESGSGKSTTAHAIIDLLPGTGAVTQGAIKYEGNDLVKLPKRKRRAYRGSRIGLVPQDPLSNLNPLYKVGAQIKEVLTVNGMSKGRAADQRVVELLEEAGLPDAETRAHQYPHEFSGGMRQRALIAAGLAARPKLLIADEPTSALDVT